MRKNLLTLFIVVLFFTTKVESSRGDSKQRKPNVIVILADDLGYADIGVHGCKDIPTPNIDSLAKNGVRFTSGYVSCPVCSPTRAGLMTGVYQERFGHEFNPGPPSVSTNETVGLSLTKITLADVMKNAGYVTGIVGKWHLGSSPKFHPLKRGFDEFFGFLGGAHSYLDSQRDSTNMILKGTEPVNEKEYLTDAFTREALAFIERHSNEPFFLYLAYNAVHAPMEATEKYLNRFQNISDEKRRIHAAMLAAMDDGIGAVLKKLREKNIEQNTLIFFLSDNGGPTKANGSRNDPLRGDKGTMYEGGIRVPFILQWQSRIPGGKLYENPVISLDILPTAMAVAGGSLPKNYSIDGVNLIPFITGEKNTPPHEILFWRSGTNYAVRKENWKLIKIEKEPIQLCDLSKDISESQNLAREKPEIVAELNKVLATWESGLSEPLWGRKSGYQKKRKDGKKTKKEVKSESSQGESDDD